MIRFLGQFYLSLNSLFTLKFIIQEFIFICYQTASKHLNKLYVLVFMTISLNFISVYSLYIFLTFYSFEKLFYCSFVLNHLFNTFLLLLLGLIWIKIWEECISFIFLHLYLFIHNISCNKYNSNYVYANKYSTFEFQTIFLHSNGSNWF